MEMINNANDVLFDLCTRLKDNGVVAKVSGDYEFSEDNISLDFVERISELDFSEHDKEFKDKIEKLKNELFDAQESADECHNKCIDLTKQIAKLKSELEAKDNLLKIKNGLCKPPMMTVVAAKTINGQDYVRLEDFMSVVDDLQNYDSYHEE